MAYAHKRIGPQLTALAVLLSFLASISPGMTLSGVRGLPAPDLSVSTLDGQTVNLSLLKGQNTLLL